MKYTYNEYLYTRDQRSPEQIRAGRREAAIGWIALIAFTTLVFVLADMFLKP